MREDSGVAGTASFDATPAEAPVPRRVTLLARCFRVLDRTAMRNWAGRSGYAAALWASLAPLMLFLHPYGGLTQDARIYIGRGVADRDPAGIGRDIMFVHDGQTGFSLMRFLVDALLSLMTPASSAMALTLVGLAVWLLAASALARTLASGRAAWATAVCIVALPTSYGAFSIFNCVEAIATPRLFAQAAVLGGLAALMTGRRGGGAALLALAVAFHPLIGLPGLGVGAALLVRLDRRWLLVLGACALAVLGAALFGVPLAARLLRPMDEVWLSILRLRSPYLFPTLWSAEAFGPILCEATAVIVASALSTSAVRALLLAGLGVALLGLAAAWLFGDIYASTLVVQLQPWRALWLLAVMGNAALGLSALALWRRGTDALLLFAPLVLAWIWSDNLWIVALLSVLTLAWLVAMLRDALPKPSRFVAVAVAGIVCTATVLDIAEAVSVGMSLAQSAAAQGGAVAWPAMVALGIQTAPVVATALALAVVRFARIPAFLPAGLLASGACACVLAAVLWDGRTSAQAWIERDGGGSVLRDLIGPGQGEVLWIDEDSQTWFLLHRPSFLNSAQAGPILFSRDLAIEWAERIRLLLRLGMARPEDAAPWPLGTATTSDTVFSSDAVQRFCSDKIRPAALVAPGDRRAAAPPGVSAELWRPAFPSQRLTLVDGHFQWRRIDLFTVMRCPGGNV